MSKSRCQSLSPLLSGRATWLAVVGLLVAVLVAVGLWFAWEASQYGDAGVAVEQGGSTAQPPVVERPVPQQEEVVVEQPVVEERTVVETPVLQQEEVASRLPDLSVPQQPNRPAQQPEEVVVEEAVLRPEPEPQAETQVPQQPGEVEIAVRHGVVPVPPDSVEIQRYPTVEAPTRVAIGREFAVQASLTEELLTPEASAAPKIFSLPKQDKWMIEVVLTGRGFEFRDGRNASLIELPRDGDSTVALFHLTAREAGESTRSVYASFYHNSRFLFRVSRPISVLTAPTAAVADANVSAAMFQLGGKGPGSTKLQLGGSDRGLTKLQLSGKGPDLAIEIISGNILIHARGFQATNTAYAPPTGLAEFLRERYARLASVAGRGVRPADRQSAKDTTKGIGREVYRRFAPPSFKKAFWSMIDRWGEDFRTIQIYSDQPLLPWELMVPSRDDKPERDHLGLEFQISRWHAREDAEFVASPPQYLVLEELVVVAPRYDPPLKSVEQEIQSIQSFPFANVRLVRGQETKLREVFSRLPRGILHFAGHGVILQNDTQGTTYAIVLEGDRILTLDEWKGMFSRDRTRHPFIFFNACDIGRTQKVVNFVDGWAPAMLDTGASGYVGALWPVADAKAAIFARRFYEALQKGLKRGDARVLNAIGEARKLYQETGDPTFLAYVYYGDNELTMKRTH